jgi:hypothetical protein
MSEIISIIYIYIHIYIYTREQYNLKTAHRNTPKLKYFISLEKTKYLPNRIENLDKKMLLSCLAADIVKKQLVD